MEGHPRTLTDRDAAGRTNSTVGVEGPLRNFIWIAPCVLAAGGPPPRPFIPTLVGGLTMVALVATVWVLETNEGVG